MLMILMSLMLNFGFFIIVLLIKFSEVLLMKIAIPSGEILEWTDCNTFGSFGSRVGYAMRNTTSE